MKETKDQRNIVDALLSALEEKEHSASFRQKLVSSLAEHKGSGIASQTLKDLNQEKTRGSKE